MSEIFKEIGIRIMSDINRHRAISEMHWRNSVFGEAIRHRVLADGLTLAHEHLLSVIAEARNKSAPDTQEATSE